MAAGNPRRSFPALQTSMILLDSNLVIYAAEPGYDAVRDFIAKNDASVSAVSKVEVLGYHKLTVEHHRRLDRIFLLLPILAVSDPVIDQAVLLRQERKMSLGDALIAATALVHGLAVATANVKDYSWIEGLTVINPLER
ncbi:MAG: type II toxin-antitoxin system VapC family toxin [Candidatus Electronema sp. VV]